MVSSISSTPWRNRLVKTGGTERTMDAFTEQNSSFSFPLRALLGEPSTSTGGGEPFRFMDEPVPSSGGGAARSFGVLGTHSVRNSGDAVWSTRWTLALNSISSPSSTLRGTFERGTVMVCVASRIYGAPTYGYISIPLVRPKNYHTNPHHGDSNIWQGTAGGRPTSCKKCVPPPSCDCWY